MQLIPSIDLRGGRCVRLLRGNFDEETVYDVDPLTLVDEYRRRGARQIHLVDLDGARDGSLANRHVILALAREHPLNLQVGGGIRSIEVVDEMLAAGVDRVVVGSSAVEHPERVAAWLERYGPEKLCLALDVRLVDGHPLLQTRGWTEGSTKTLWNAVNFFLPHGLRHVLCTDIDRDGALSGPNLLLYGDCVTRYPSIRWQASGGIRGVRDLAILEAAGVTAAISGKALLEGRLSDDEIRDWLAR
jgi:phosphoribosylformimino-5-aminoimidazole carboxamide ribotide isomerase